MTAYKNKSAARTLITVLVPSLISSALSLEGQKTDYNDQSSWPGDCTTGQRQSPIDIKRDNLVAKSFPPIVLSTNAEKNLNAVQLTNNGKAVIMLDDQFSSIEVSGGGLNLKYKLLAPHFHWGNDDGEGSEHLVDGRAYPLEMHAVLIKQQFANISVALASGQKDAVAVLGVFFELGEGKDSPLASLIAPSNGLQGKKVDTAVDGALDVSFRDLLPKDLSHFYRYDGSLTTPSCKEQVVWTVFETPQIVPKALLDEFRKMTSEMGGPIVKNFRAPQPLNGRKVYTSAGARRKAGDGSEDAEQSNGASEISLTVGWAFLVLVIPAILEW